MFPDLVNYIYAREWSIYPFIPSLFSLLLTLVLIPIYEQLFDDRLETFLQQKGLEQASDLVKTMTAIRGLQIAYLTEVPVFAVSVIATVQSNHSGILVALAILGVLLILTIPPRLFLSDPDFLVLTPFPQKRRPAFLARQNWTQKSFFAALLVLLNLLFLVILIITLPQKTTP